MIKKIYIIIVITILIGSCGKKGDPVFNNDHQNTRLFSTSLSTLS
jgi:hypothetical protein